MILKMYVIYDTKIEAYDRPFFAQSDGEAERIIYESMQDKRSTIGKYPADYNLFFAGKYDGFKGMVESITLVHLGNALEIAKKWNREAEKVRQQLNFNGDRDDEIGNES